jgi:excinuclease UvrABC nuclease subunit
MCDCGNIHYCNICTNNGQIEKVCKTCGDSSDDFPGSCTCRKEIRRNELVEEIREKIMESCDFNDIEELQNLFDDILSTDESENSQYLNFVVKYETPLGVACLNGYLEIVKLFLENGANVNFKDDRENTPLHRACENCHHEIVELLLKHGAEKNCENQNFDTPEELASYCEDPKKQEARAAIIELLSKP